MYVRKHMFRLLRNGFKPNSYPNIKSIKPIVKYKNLGNCQGKCQVYHSVKRPVVHCMRESSMSGCENSLSDELYIVLSWPCWGGNSSCAGGKLGHRVHSHLWKILALLSLEKFSSCNDSWVRKATAR